MSQLKNCYSAIVLDIFIEQSSSTTRTNFKSTASFFTNYVELSIAADLQKLLLCRWHEPFALLGPKYFHQLDGDIPP